jgi:hypothetical protein
LKKEWRGSEIRVHSDSANASRKKHRKWLATMTRKRRYLISAAVLAACVGIVIGVAWFNTTPEPSVTLMDFRRIKLDMSVSEVNGIFGMRGERGPCMLGECHWSWRQEGNYAAVSVGQRDGKVKCGYFVTPDGKQHWLSTEDDRLPK